MNGLKLFFALIIALLFIAPSPASATGWWNSSYSYRKPMAISGSGSDLTDYQVNVTPYIYNETGLVGSWHFSNNATDSSGYGNTGTLYGATTTTDGKFGNATTFDGTDDYVQVASPQRLATGNAPRSLEAWIKPAKLSGPMYTAVGYGTWTTNQAFMLGTNNNYVYLAAYAGDVTGTIPLSAGNWYHIVATHNGTDVAIYVNGTFDTSAARTLSTTINSDGIMIGKKLSGDTNNPWFNGTIDEVRIYNRTLSATEIQQHYLATKARLDYQDIRFTDSDGATLLPFWMESDGKFWVKVPSIPTTGTTIYAYYGNPPANDAQNATGTFEFFDDFDDGNYNGWTVSSGTWSASGGYLRDVGIANSRITTSIPTITSFAFEFKYYLEGETDCQPGISTPDNGYIFHLNVPAAFWLGYKDTSLRANADTWLISGTGTPATGAWYKSKLTRLPDGNMEIFLNDVSKGTVLNNYATSFSQVVLLGNSAGSRYERYDDLRVRKYASPEPLAAVNGTEEESQSVVYSAKTYQVDGGARSFFANGENVTLRVWGDFKSNATITVSDNETIKLNAEPMANRTEYFEYNYTYLFS